MYCIRTCNEPLYVWFCFCCRGCVARLSRGQWFLFGAKLKYLLMHKTYTSVSQLQMPRDRGDPPKSFFFHFDHPLRLNFGLPYFLNTPIYINIFKWFSSVDHICNQQSSQATRFTIAWSCIELLPTFIKRIQWRRVTVLKTNKTWTNKQH